ncbi:MAG: hypothetical protein M3Y71_08605, partial [Actinomycetota bacterium]|nr:hypothetical protein [Actinomycetota bacterium]
MTDDPTDPARHPSSVVSCPACAGGVLTTYDGERLAGCGACGHRVHPSLLAEALWLQGERRLLDARLGWVESRIAVGDTDPTGWTRPGSAPP